MIARRTFVVRFSQADGTVLLENSLTRERVRLRDLAQIGQQIERWVADPPAGSPAPRRPPVDGSP